MSVIIKVKDLSKAYQLGQIGTGTISRDIERWWAMARGKEDPFLKIGEVNDRSVKGESNIVWSLKDINFEIEQGSAVGVIGRNGAGKSTLLKLLSRVTSPTTGTIKAKGRIASLLEVGTGFHPELTGRENIYLNGAILGMRKKEIDRKLSEIIDFSGVERYIDTPVKRYSSGMYVRLAFAVAAHLDSEILIVDEVLAVGDAEFQKKCLGKMRDVSSGQGRTVLFVSHNMTAISTLCTSGIYLKNGYIELHDNNVHNVISAYANDGNKSSSETWEGNEGDENIRIYKTSVYPVGDENSFQTDKDIIIEMKGEVLKPVFGLIMGLTLWSQFEYELAYMLYDDNQAPPIQTVQTGEFTKRFRIPAGTLAEGIYRIQFDVGIHMLKRVINTECDLNFSVMNTTGNGRRFVTEVGTRGRYSILRPNWIINE